MKKIIMLSVVLLPSFAFAQFSKGQAFIGGSLSTSLFNSDEQATAPNYSSSKKNNALTLLPLVGFFLNRKIAVGTGVGYATSYTESNYTNYYYDTNGNFVTAPAFQKSWANGINVAPFIRYYIPLTSSFYFAAHGQINFMRANRKDVQNNGQQEITQENPYYSTGLTLKPVFIFFPSSRLGIEASWGGLGYTYTRYLPDVSSSSSVSLSLGSFSFGLAYYFAKK